MQRGDRADDRDRRRAHAGLCGARGDVAERARDRALVGERAALHDRDGLAVGATAGDELRCDAVEAAHAHVEDERAGEGGQRRPVDERVGLGGVLVAGDERDRCREAALRDRDAGVRRCRDARRHARHDFEVQPRGAQQLRLLAAATEDERVAALQPHDLAAGARVAQQQLVRRLLRDLRPAADLADVDELGVRTGAAERAVGDQLVVEDHVGARDELQRAGGHEAEVAGSGADEVRGHRPHPARPAPTDSSPGSSRAAPTRHAVIAPVPRPPARAPRRGAAARRRPPPASSGPRARPPHAGSARAGSRRAATASRRGGR